jgi:hypothetical protein
MISIGIPETINNKPLPGEWLRLVQQTAYSFNKVVSECGEPAVVFSEVCDPHTNQRDDGFELTFYSEEMAEVFQDLFIKKVDCFCSQSEKQAPHQVTVQMKSLSIILISGISEVLEIKARRRQP